VRRAIPGLIDPGSRGPETIPPHCGVFGDLSGEPHFRESNQVGSCRLVPSPSACVHATRVKSYADAHTMWREMNADLWAGGMATVSGTCSTWSE